MGRDHASGGPSALLPSHRFYSSSSIRASPFYTIPVHYLKRRGVLLLLVSMAVIAYLHYLYFPSPSSYEHTRLKHSKLLEEDKNGYPDYMSIRRIREPPLGGPAPVNGVDEGGFEIDDEPLGTLDDSGFVEVKSASSRNGQRQQQTVKEDDTDDDQSFTGQQKEHLRRPIQFNFRDTLPRTGARADLNKQRQIVVREMIQHAWAGYKEYAAPHDEVKPVTAGKVDDLHGWGATLVDGMDTLLLSGMVDEYQIAKRMLLDLAREHRWNQHDIPKASVQTDINSPEGVEYHDDVKPAEENNRRIDKSGSGAVTESISFFDGVVHYLGGLLSVADYEENRDPEVLKTAIKLGDQLTVAFQGVNTALPASNIFAKAVLLGKASLAEVGSFQLEFRKLSQLSGDDKYRDMAQRNFDYLESFRPKIPGLYPAYFDPDMGVAHDYVASFGSLSDSFYEYLLKTYILTGDARFKDLYIATVEAMHTNLISRPHKKTEPYLVLGIYDTATETLVPKMDHLSCFAPGLLAMGARVFGRAKDMTVARGLMETCYLSYKNSARGLGADEIAFLGTEFTRGKQFEMPQPSGFYAIDAEYGLRPETIESLFVMYRITGDAKYQDYAWTIAQAIEENCRTKYGYSTLASVMDASEGMTDRMPSYFLGQTLKYLYLIFSPPELASLDDFIFTTEGHLLKFPIP
ncbi:hypothetical protein BGX28_003589 [Mortierella sp. GBA30]|nr:hypothetical protein BGX28_003589 [Mortierella sp. GBA30]